jgi:hypothetical protein
MGRVDLEKQFDGLRLEVGRLNCFMEHETMVNPQVKKGIFVDPSLSAAAGGSDNRRVDLFNRDHEYGSNFANSRIPGTGTSQLGFCIATLSTLMNRVVLIKTIPMLSPSVQVRASYLKFIFRYSMLKTSNCGNHVVKVTLTCIVLRPLFG